MTSLFRNLRLPLCLLAGVPAILVAQGTSTAALMGTIKDPSGKPFAGATIRVTSPSLIGGQRVVVTTDNGGYRIPMLPPGQYRISVEAKGLNTLVGSELLELGKTSTVNFKFAAAASAVVEVVESQTSIETAPSTLTQNYSLTELTALPSERSLSGIMSLTPGVNNNSAWGGYRGENAWMMDGINISDPSGGTQWIFPNVEWFSEVQVGGIGAPAEFGSYSGGFINGLIKRGGNNFEGSFSTYYGDSRWQAISTNWQLEAADKVVNPAKNTDFSFTFGGPIIKDKLWFFSSAERIQTQTSRPGALAQDTRMFIMGLTKFTWQVLPTATLEFLAEYDYVGQDRRGIDKYTLPIATVKEFAPSRSFGVTWTQTLGSDKVLTVKSFGYSGRYDLLPYNGNAMGLDAYDTLNGIEYFNNSTYADYNYRNRASILATLDIFKTGLLTAGDSHAFRIGFEREQSSDEELEIIPGGVYGDAYTDTGSNGQDALFTDTFYTGGGWNIRQRVDRTTLFVQDDWKVNDRLTLRPGLRFEQFQGRYYGASSPLWDKKTIAPRFGFSLALTADLRTVLKGHWGKYYAGYNTYFIDRAIQSAIPKEYWYYWGAPADDYYGTEIDPYNPSAWPKADPNDPNNPAYFVRNNLSQVDPNAKQPYVNEVTFSLDHKFSGNLSNWSVSASWVYRQWKDMITRIDKAPDPDGYWRTYVNPITKGTVNAFVSGLEADQHDYWIANDPRLKRRYTATSLGVDRKLANGWSFNGTVTKALQTGTAARSDSYGDVLVSPNNQINFDGRLPNYNDYEVKARGLWEFPWKMRVSGTYQYLSGTRWTPYYRTGSIPTRYLINTEILGSQKYPSRQILDLRLSQFFPLWDKVRGEFFIDIFNVLNRGTTIAGSGRINSSNTSSSAVYAYYQYPSTVELARRLQLGFRLSF